MLYLNAGNATLQLGRHLYSFMEFAKAIEKRATILEQKAIKAEKELCEALTCMFEAKKEFWDQKEQADALMQYHLFGYET